MIKDVTIKKVTQYHDDRGFFTEMAKFGEETFHEIKQTSYAETYPGVIKAFHWHKKQWDIWCVVKGQAKVVLYDLRADSSTKGETQVVYAGERNMVVIAIPIGVAHGYQVIGSKPMGIVYHTTEAYDPADPDEERIPFDDPKINFDWEIKNR
ncbi:MAG: dTDP-4-dehydrorhamnose 3,5-epimerase family protein [bacterium]|nr:dTDP-4-dehydrorhamnose 3,5-epimerase family protein [bacterium]